MTNHRILLLTLFAMALTSSAVHAQFQHPVLRVPQMSAAPTLDGKIGDGEWKEAAAFTGVSGNPLGTPFLLPQMQQVVWFLGFRGRKIYIGMKSPHPKGTYPAGRVKQDDDPDVLWGDHVEIQFLTHERDKAAWPGKGFFKLMVNAWGALHDTHWYNGTPGTEDLWSCGGEAACFVTDEEWQMELVVDATRMGVERLDGTELVVQLVRAADTGGLYYAGWVGKAWMAWHSFAACRFDAKAPVIAFEKLGRIMEGGIDAEIRLTGSSAGEVPVTVELLVEDAEGKTICKEEQTATVKAGADAVLSFRKKDLPITNVDIDGKRNHFEIKASYKEGRDTRVLYHNRSPFMQMNEAWRKKYWEPWVNARPQAGEWDAVFANLPYAGKAKASVDVDFFGIEEKIRGAARFDVVVRPAGGGKDLARGESTMEAGAGSILFDLPDLPDGEYEAIVRLFEDDGGKPVDSKAIPFERKHYPWENNQLGRSDEVIPPYVFMAVNPRILHGGGPQDRYGVYFDKVKDRTLVTCWGRAYEIGDGGLLDQVLATPPTGTCGRPENLLAAPMRLVLHSGGEAVELAGSGSKVTSAARHRVDIAGRLEGGGIGVDVAAFEEYDGWYEVRLDLAPEGEVAAQALDLEIDLRHITEGDRYQPPFPVDTLYAQRLGMGRDSYYGGIPREPGVHFRSSDLFPPTARTGPADVPKDWKSFLPMTYVGNGDRGLWFFAWSDAGWILSDEDPAVQVERLADGNVRLRVRLVSGPVTLSEPRRIRFALQAAPIKANDPFFRSRIGRIMHDTSGYRYYGDSVDSFALHTDEDFEALRKFIVHGTAYQEEKSQRYGHWHGRLGKKVREGRADRIMLYGSQWMTGAGAPEFDTFAGEWLGRTNWKPNPDMKFAGKWNYGHTVQWNTPRQLHPTRVNWPQSMLDFFVWYHEKLIDRAGFNGTWWDNCYSGTVTDYDPELGRLDAKWNLYNRRQLCKRLNVVGWEHLRPPCWSMNTQVDMAWCQVFWMVEGDWGQSSADITALEEFGSLGWFRAQTRPKSTVMIAKKSYITHFKGSTPETDRRCKRSADALLFSHDIPPVFCPETVHKLEYVVDYANTAKCLFMGYWATSQLVQSPDPAIRPSIYQNSTRDAAVIVFLNTMKKDRYLGGTAIHPAGVIDTPSGQLAAADRALDVGRVYDLESGKPVAVAFRDGRLVIDEPYVVDGHGYRLLALEGE